MGQSTARTRLAATVVQFGSFVVILGVPDGLLGVLWPTMRRGLHRPLADLGLLVASGTVLYVVGGLVGERVRHALGLRGTLFWSTLLGLGALLGWALAPGWWVILAALALLGLVKGVLDSVLNAVAAIDGGRRRLGFLHASWAIGGTLGPVLVATLAAGGQWREAVAVVVAATAALVPVAALSREEASERSTATPRRERATAGGHWQPLAATTLAFGLYTAAEAGPVSWGTTYLVSDRGLPTASAAVAMAVFWAALTLGRLGLALFPRVRPSVLLEVSCLSFVAGMAMFWLLPGELAVLGLPVAGLGSATIFPLYVALTPDRLGEEVTGRAVGYSIAAAAAGGPVAVAVFGLLAAHLGTAVLGPCLFLAAVVMYAGHRLLAAVVSRPALSAPPA